MLCAARLGVAIGNHERFGLEPTTALTLVIGIPAAMLFRPKE